MYNQIINRGIEVDYLTRLDEELEARGWSAERRLARVNDTLSPFTLASAQTIVEFLDEDREAREETAPIPDNPLQQQLEYELS